MARRQDTEIKFLTPEETEALFDAIRQDQAKKYQLRNQAIFMLGKYCALRASEIGLITMKDFNQKKNTIFCRRLKGSKNNTLEIVDDEVLDILHQYYWQMLKDSHSPYLFPSQHGYPISRKTLHWLMNNYCSQMPSDYIPEEKRHFHVLKHTRAMELIDYESIDLRDVQYWLGHRNIANTMIYLDYTTKKMNTLFRKIEREERKKIVI